MKNPILKFLTVAALSLGSIGATQAAVVTEYAMNFLAVTQGGTMVVNGATGGTWNYYAGYNPWVGARENPAAYASVGLAFYLPTLTLGQSFDTFTINVNQYSIWDPATKIDLYGLGTSATQSPSSIPYYAGTNDTSKTLLQSNYLTGTSSAYNLATWTSSINIASYVNSLYSGGAPSQQYLMLRLSAQDEAAGLIAIGSFSMLNGADPAANATTGVFTGAPLDWPQNYASYEIASVPEPSTWAVLTGGVGMLVLLRRRA